MTFRQLHRVAAFLRGLDTKGLRMIAGHHSMATDAVLRLTGRAANRSAVWMAVAAAVWTRGTPRTRRAAVEGLAAIATTSVIANAVLKPLIRRRRPAASVNVGKTGPTRTSFPSGHAASAAAFAITVGLSVPPLRVPLGMAAALVGYSRIHERRHYPSDVLAGTLVGAASAGIVLVTAGRIRRTR